MSADPPCRSRRFQLRLAPDYVEQYRARLHWLRTLVERLGLTAISLWRETLADGPDLWRDRILAEGWRETQGTERIDTEAALAAAREDIFPAEIEGLSPEEAAAIVTAAPPLRAACAAFADLNVSREISAYDALHLWCDDLARLSEALIARHGKRGEMMAYDANLHAQVAEQRHRLDPAVYLLEKGARFRRGYADPNLNTAGLDREILRSTDRELVWKVRQCEWARYFRAHHPAVGSILSCTSDHAVYGSYDPSIRLQLTSTLMEGAPACEFRLYRLDEAVIPKDGDRL